jgi:hypothetical protein
VPEPKDKIKFRNHVYRFQDTTVAVFAGMDDSEREKIESQKEERFILNLTRMTEDTNAVFPEHFLEFIIHLTYENVKELVVIESGYTSVLFNDVEFAFPACDIEVNRSSVILFLRKIANSFLFTVLHQEI